MRTSSSLPSLPVSSGSASNATSAAVSAPNTDARKSKKLTPPLGTRRAVRGGVFGNYVDQFDIFLPVIALAPASTQLIGSDILVANTGLFFRDAAGAARRGGDLRVDLRPDWKNGDH